MKMNKITDSVSPLLHIKRNKEQTEDYDFSKTEPKSRKPKILNFILVTLILLILATILLLVLYGYGSLKVRDFYFILVSVILVFLLVAFILNKKGKYVISAVILIICAFVGPWVSVIDSHLMHTGDYIPLIFTALTIFLSVLLLDLWVTILLSFLQITGIVILLTVIPDLSAINWQSLVSFILFSSSLGIVYGYIHQKDYKYIEAQAQRLLENETKLKEMSVRDELTGLYNWRFMMETLDREISRSRRNQLSIAVIILDIDNFKEINDQYGHHVGDLILAQTGKSVKTLIRAGDVACRYGGDEFVMILPDTVLATAVERSMHLHKEITSLQHQLSSGNSITVSVSIGAAAFPEHGQTGEELMAAADGALYRAKGLGKNRVVIAEQLHAE